LLYIIVSLAYIFLRETHTNTLLTHAEACLLLQLCARFISGCPIQSSAVSRLWGFSANAALMNTAYLLPVDAKYSVPVTDVKIRLEP